MHLAPLPLSSKEEQNISSNFFTEVDLDHSPDGSFKIVSLWSWGIEDLNWVCAPRNALENEKGKVKVKEEEEEEEEEKEEEKIKRYYMYLTVSPHNYIGTGTQIYYATCTLYECWRGPCISINLLFK